MIKGAIFDFNGTLFDDSDIHKKVWEDIYLEITKGKGDVEEFKKNVLGLKNLTVIENIYKEVAEDFDLEKGKRVSQDKEKRYRDYAYTHNRCHLIKGAEKLLDELKERKIPIILCSASIIENINFFYEAFGLDSWFNKEESIYDKDDDKPKSQMIIEAAKTIGVDIKDCVVFEDSDHGLKSAIEVGAKVIIQIDPHDIKIKDPKITQKVKDYDEIDRALLFD